MIDFRKFLIDHRNIGIANAMELVLADGIKGCLRIGPAKMSNIVFNTPKTGERSFCKAVKPSLRVVIGGVAEIIQQLRPTEYDFFRPKIEDKGEIRVAPERL